MSCPTSSDTYYTKTNASINPYWNCSTKATAWDATAGNDTIQVQGITSKVSGYVQADMNNTAGGDLGNKTYITGCPYGMAYCSNPTSDGLACRNAKDFQCVFDPTFLGDGEGSKISADMTNISKSMADEQQTLFNLEAKKGPAYISVLRPRVSAIPSGSAACACTETGLLPPMKTRDSKSMCTLDNPCFEDSPGPFTLKTDGTAVANTALNCSTGGVCSANTDSVNYDTDGAMGTGGLWSIIPAEGSDAQRYVRSTKTSCKFTPNGECVKAGEMKSVIGWDPANDHMYMGVKYTDDAAGSTLNKGNSWPNKATKFNDADVFTSSKADIKSFCGRHKTLRACQYGSYSDSSSHFVAYGEESPEHFKKDAKNPTYGALALATCNQDGCDSMKLNHFSNAGTSNKFKLSGARSAETFVSQHEVCKYTGATDADDMLPNPFLRVWAQDGLGFTDASDGNLYPGDTVTQEANSTSSVYRGSLTNPIKMSGGYADISAFKCAGESCSDAWCGISTSLYEPTNAVSGAAATYVPYDSTAAQATQATALQATSLASRNPFHTDTASTSTKTTGGATTTSTANPFYKPVRLTTEATDEGTQTTQTTNGTQSSTPALASASTSAAPSSLGHGMIGLAWEADSLGNWLDTPPDRPLINSSGSTCGNQYYRYYAPLWMGNRGSNAGTGDAYSSGEFNPPNVLDPTEDELDSLLTKANWAAKQYYQRYPQMMRGALISATGPADANFGTDEVPANEEYISALDGQPYCGSTCDVSDDSTAASTGTSALTPVTRCVLDLDRMLGLGTYDASSAVWTPTPNLTFDDRENALRGVNRTTGGPEQFPLSEQDLLHLWYTMRLDISLAGTDGQSTGCQSLPTICQNVSPDAWGKTSSSCTESSSDTAAWYENYDGTLGPLVNMCSFATPQYTDLMTLRANFKTFASVFHHVLKNAVRGVGAFELDSATLDYMKNDVKAYRMNEVCANASTSSTDSAAHLGCSPMVLSRGFSGDETGSRTVKSMGDLARWYWNTLTDDMKEEVISGDSGGLCTYDPSTGESPNLSCNSDGTTNASSFQNAYLPECRSVNRKGQAEYCALKHLTTFSNVADSCWYGPSEITDGDEYFRVPSSSDSNKVAWKTPATIDPVCANEQICIQEISTGDITAGGDVDFNDINMNQCCVTNMDGTSTGDSCDDSVSCSLFSTTSQDPEGICSGTADSNSCTTCVNCKDLLTESDTDVLQGCGTYCSALFPGSGDTDCQNTYANSDAAGGLSKDEQLELACRICGTMDSGTGGIAACDGTTESSCKSAGYSYGV